MKAGDYKMMMEISVDENLYKTYPSIRLGLLTFNCNVRPSSSAFWQRMNEEVIPEVLESIEGKSWNEIPGIRGSRLVYKAFGRNPTRYRVSSEALIRRIKRGEELYHVNSVVDVNNFLSIKSGLSVGSYDLDKTAGPLVLRKTFPHEGYEGIGKEFLDLSDMLELADEKGIFGSTMADNKRTMVTLDSHHILVCLYCFEDEIDLEALVKEAEEEFRTNCEVTDLDSRIIGKKASD